MKKIVDSLKLSTDTLKIIAYIIMLVDHSSYCLLHYYMTVFHMDIPPQSYSTYNTIYNIGRGIGRIAFPIFCFFLVEGFCRTRNVAKYAFRLLVFAIISEIPFDLAHYHQVFYMEHQNTMFSLFTGLLMLIVLDYIINKLVLASNYFKVILCICTVAGFCELASHIGIDYSYKGMFLIAVLYLTRSIRSLQLITGAATSSLNTAQAPIAFLLLYFYDSEVKPKIKYFFYLFYPIHLLLLYFVALLIFQQ